MDNRNKMANAFNEANEEFFSFDDQMYADDWSADDWNADDDNDFSNDVYANGNMNKQGNVPTSTPFIVSLTNTTTSAISNVAFLNAANSVQDTTTFGLPTGITATYGVAGVSYLTFLYSLLTQSAKIGITYMQSDSQVQLLQTLKLETYNVRGSGAYDTMTPIINPFQQQAGVLVLGNQFILNGFTKLTIASIAASTSVSFKFYPVAEESSIGGLTGKGANKLSNPKISGVKQLK